MRPAGPVRLLAPAKLTRTLRVLGRRPDGYHELSAEMVSVDLADELVIDPTGDGLDVDTAELRQAGAVLDAGEANLVNRALRVVGRRAHVAVRKRIPLGGGLGGGSSDAAAVLRWAGGGEPGVAAALGADVPFCVRGGRARVRGIGERVEPLAFEARTFALLLPPFGVDTATVYRAWDALHPSPAPTDESSDDPAAGAGDQGNDLEGPALLVEPRLAGWRDALADATGHRPRLAGSGSTWFVELGAAQPDLGDARFLTFDGERAPLVVVHTVPPGWEPN
jgi:4-diphosphocytidyl-2-C-methyl-D-erythritol kinase